MLPYDTYGGSTMPSFRTYDRSGFKVDLSPSGLRRFKLLEWLFPYLYGSIVEFKCKIEPKQKGNLPFDWILWRWDGIQKHEVGKGKGELPMGNKMMKLNIGYLSVTGHHILDMRWGETVGSAEPYDIVANFTLMDRDIHTQKLVFIISSGFAGAIIGAIAAIIANLLLI